MSKPGRTSLVSEWFSRFRLGVGMSFVMTHTRSGFFYYERLISRERYTQNSLALGIRLEF